MLKLLALLVIATPAALLLRAPPPVYCSVRAVTSYEYGIRRGLLIRLDPACPPEGVARVQAVSASRSRREPQRGAWVLNDAHPTRTEFVPPFWRIEYWDGAAWIPARGR